MHDDRPYPLSRRHSVEGLPASGRQIKVTATDVECAALAEILDIPAIKRLEGHFTLFPWRRDGVKVVGRIEADVVQTCVVTLEPVAETISEALERRFLPGIDIEEASREELIEADAPDAPENLESNAIDLGAMTAEHMVLGLNPYPRAPGAVFEDIIEDSDEDTKEPSPFAALAEKKKPGPFS